VDKEMRSIILLEKRLNTNSPFRGWDIKLQLFIAGIILFIFSLFQDRYEIKMGIFISGIAFMILGVIFTILSLFTKKEDEF
jgi:hypothetical protein